MKKKLLLSAFVAIVLNISFIPKAFSQYDYVLCENIKFKKVESDKSLAVCAITQQSLINFFGDSGKSHIVESPEEYIYISYPGCVFTFEPMFTTPSDFMIFTSKSYLTISDSIELKVGSSVEKVVRNFPNSFSHQVNFSNGMKHLILYFVTNRKELNDIKVCTERLVITYIPESKTIHKIHYFAMD